MSNFEILRHEKNDYNYYANNSLCAQKILMLSIVLVILKFKILCYKKCVNKDPDLRPSCEELLSHPFFKDVTFKYPPQKDVEVQKKVFFKSTLTQCTGLYSTITKKIILQYKKTLF